MKRRGISTVVATVLTVLLTVAAVVTLWASVQPLLSNVGFADVLKVKFAIDTKGSYTVYDPETGYLRVRVTRGADNDDPVVIALKFVMSTDGNSISRTTYNVVPPNHALVYYMLIGFDVDLRSVKLVPVFLVDGKEIEGQAVDLEMRIPINPGALKKEVGTVPIVPDPETPVFDGLVLHYSFDGEYANETQILDLSGEGHSGTLHGDVEMVQDGPREFAMFDGAGDYIILADGEGLADDTAGGKTITFWAKFECPIDAANINQVPLGSYENYVVLFVDPCHTFENTELRINYDLPPAAPRTFVSEDVWNDLAGWEFFSIVFDTTANEIRVYRNGELADSASGVTLSGSNPSPDFYVGTSADASGGPNPTSCFKGSLDELRVYDRVLSTEEIQTLLSFAA